MHDSMIPPMHRLKDILFSESGCKKYLLENNVFSRELQCSACGSEMKGDTERWSFQCRVKACRKEVSMSTNTLFENSRLRVRSADPDERYNVVGLFLAERSTVVSSSDNDGVSASNGYALLLAVSSVGSECDV